MKNGTKIFAIVVGFNSLPYLKNFFKAIFEQSFLPEVIFVDNGSNDSSVDYVKSNFQKVKIIRNRKNLGFAKASNQGFKRALEEGAKYVVLLNPDTEPSPNFLEDLYNFAEENPQAGVIGSRVVFSHNPEVLNSTGISLNLMGLSWDRDFGKRDLTQDFLPVEVTAVSGCAMFIRSEIFKKIGFFDEKFWAFSEDLDFCLRLREKTDYKIFYFPKALIKHQFSASFDTRKKFKKFLMARNSFYIIIKHFPRKFLLKSFLKRFSHKLVDLAFAIKIKDFSEIFLELKILFSVIFITPFVFFKRAFTNGQEKIEKFLEKNYQIPHHFPPMENFLKKEDKNRLLIGVNEKFLESGFYHLEMGFPLYRWIGKKSECFLEVPKEEQIFLQLHLAPPAHQQALQVTAYIEGEKVGTFNLEKGWQTIVLPFFAKNWQGKMVRVVLKVNETFVPSKIFDNRELGVMVNEISLLSKNSPFLRKNFEISSCINMGEQEAGIEEGFYSLEKDEFYWFRWMGNVARVKLKNDIKNSKYLEILANVPDNNQRILEIFLNGRKIGQGVLKNGWRIYRCLINVLNQDQHEILMKIEKPLPECYLEKGDNRKLGAMVAKIAFCEK